MRTTIATTKNIWMMMIWTTRMMWMMMKAAHHLHEQGNDDKQGTVHWERKIQAKNQNSWRRGDVNHSENPKKREWNGGEKWAGRVREGSGYIETRYIAAWVCVYMYALYIWCVQYRYSRYILVQYIYNNIYPSYLLSAYTWASYFHVKMEMDLRHTLIIIIIIIFDELFPYFHSRCPLTLINSNYCIKWTQKSGKQFPNWNICICYVHVQKMVNLNEWFKES